VKDGRGGNPEMNPFVRFGAQLPSLKVSSSAEFISRDLRRTNPFLADFTVRHDTQYICLTPLLKEQGLLVGLAVMRTARQGEISEEQKKIFAAIAPHVRSAVRSQMALEHQGAVLMAAALEALSLAVFVCDREGVVRAMTPAAETLAGQGGPIGLRLNRLRVDSAPENSALMQAMADAAADVSSSVVGTGAGPIVVRNPNGLPLVLEILRVPRREHGFRFDPRVLVVVRGGGSVDPGRLAHLLQSIYGLTAAETDVALSLAEGRPPDVIAASRQRSVGTIRVQIRSLYGKLGVNRQSELLALLRQLG